MSILIGNTYYTNISPVMTSNTAPSPYVAECSIVCVNAIWKAFDGLSDTLFRTNISTVTPFTMSLDYGEGNEKVVSGYRLDCSYNANWTMKSWEFEGSNDNNTWYTLDSRSNISWSEDAIQGFAFDNLTKYRYYRFNVLEKNGTNSVCINEIELLQEDPSTNLEFRKVKKSNLPNSKTDGVDTVYFTEDGEMYVTDKSGNLKQSCGTKISTYSNNAIKTKTDGLFVEDLSAKINQISTAQKTVNEVGTVSLMSEPKSFTITKATTAGTPVVITVNTDIVLVKDIDEFDCIEFLFTINSSTRKRPAKVTRFRTSTINYNNSTTEDHKNGSLINVSIEAETTSSGSFGLNHLSLLGWFKDERTFYVQKIFNPTTSNDWLNLEITDIIGVKDRSIVIDPLEYVNSSSGIEDTPVGHIIPYMGNTAPKHYLICDGTEYNITDYPYLAQHFTDEFGSVNYFGGDGTITFAVPDLKGEFLRGTGTNSHENQGSGSEVGEHQDATTFAMPAGGSSNGFMRSGSSTDNPASYVTNIDSSLGESVNSRTSSGSANSIATEVSYQYTSRPTNTSVLYCIKYEPTYFMKNTCNGNNAYSTDELVVGRWIDGKPLYSCTCEIEPDSSTGMKTKYFTQIKNAENVTVDFNRSFLYDSSTGETISLFNNWDSNEYGLGLTALGEETQIKVLMYRPLWNNLPGYITFMYTKTTDSPSSGKITNDGDISYTDEEIESGINEILGGEY